ncbi:hypothetical protein [Herbaspirillum sp. ST 5-3]|uniref:hypothetical protein n=1 Tax=Oxalobacteraceae TaxID=75682 RepID=UPI0010A5A014|nr:hypothetical protein [Herbaspirillum sp. ST 5-3]
MAKLNAMAPDSAGFKVLMRLYQLGGKATIAQLVDALWTEFRSTPRFHQIASKPLLERGLAHLAKRKTGETLEITKEGRLLVERYQSLLPRPRTGTATPPALDVKKHLSFGQGRPGALDYRNMPSVMGGERVPFRRDEEEKAA